MNYKNITEQSYTQAIALLRIALFTIHYSLFTAFQ